MFNFKDKIALVTGSASGIGFQLVKELLRNGVKGVSMVDVDAEQGATAKKELSEEFGAERVAFYHCDVTKSDQLKDVFESSFKHWSGLDIVIGNAGMCKEQKWETMVSLNCAACVSSTYLGFEYMSKAKKGKGGVIVNVSSIAGVTPYDVLPVYSGTKSFVKFFSCALGSERYYNYNGVRIFVVCPGPTDTPILNDIKNYSPVHIHPTVSEMCVDMAKEYSLQSKEFLAENIVKLITEAKNGTAWTIMGGKPPYEATI